MLLDQSEGSILFLHGVTGASALRMMLPWLDETQQKVGLGASFQSVAAALAAQGSSTGLLKATPPPKSSPEALRKLAANSPDEHTIKLVEAAIREYNIRKQPELLRAAEVWMTLS